MELALTFATAVLYSIAFYLLMSKHIIRMLLGVVILSNAVNLSIFINGRLTTIAPPLIPSDLSVPVDPISNPLPQALVLTAIVIAFSFFAFLLVLSYRAYQDLNTDDTDEMRVAEPKEEGLPPLGY
ncbi:Na+/H+ antiporter subunit C [Fulvimarina endophytica]|uniref:Na+/H+ antiporter subunit C n=1 Tax=Fulvimarina endophytica TaxID=2293836 RepID=A0A371X0D4_9HYPH|nr:Na+/H+ antiporter subunit C [Fulvimarina endophytica]RFC62666.1 Na+/H+ antiporter subunit C [Fulvimarina endophytica]